MSRKIFLSYARGDDESFVRRLSSSLQSAGFDVWFDRVSMPSRQLTFYQEIRDAVNNCDRLVLVVGPKAVASDYVSQEWRFAYFEAMKCVNPIVRLGGYDLMPEDLRLFHAEDFQDDAAFDFHLKNLIRQLTEDPPLAGPLVGVPDLPPHFISQLERVKELRALLLEDLQKPVVVAGLAGRVGLQGMTGIGKSVLAASLVGDPEVRRAFPDGVYWLSLGQAPHVLEMQQRLGRELGDTPIFTTIEEGKERLRALLDKRATLIVLDDAWQRLPVESFTVAGARNRVLLTTQDASLLMALVSPSNAFKVKLPEQVEALSLLSKSSNLLEQDLPPEAAMIVELCGRLPLGIALCGGMVRAGISWDDLKEALTEHDLQWLADPHPAEEQHANIWKTMDVSVRVLPEDERQRFTELAAFHSDGAAQAAIETLWLATAGLQSRATHGLLSKFAAHSLVTLSGNPPHVRLHDLVRSFALGMAIKRLGSKSALHDTLLNAYAANCPHGWPSGPNDGYFFEYLARHLVAARRIEELRLLLVNFEWLKNKLDATNIVALLSDFDNNIADADALLIGGALRLSATAMASDPGQLAGQLLARLLAVTTPPIMNLLSQATASLKPHTLRPLIASLTPPGTGLLRTISAGDDSILAVAATPDGSRVVSGSHFGHVRVWDLESGSLSFDVKAHAKRIRSVAVAPNGKFCVSAGEDGVVGVWNLSDGAALPSTPLSSSGPVAVFPDSTRIALNLGDGKLSIWDRGTGAESQRFTYPASINSLAITIDGNALITGHSNGTLSKRDLNSSAILWTVNCHRRVLVDAQGNRSESTIGNEVPALTVTPDGTRAISGGCDATVQVWNIATGECIHKMPGHQHFVFGVGATADSSRAVSGSLDKLVCIWDLATGNVLRLLRGHTEGVWALAMHPKEDRAISGGDDRKVRIWDLNSNPELPAPRGHAANARCVLAMANDQVILSGSEDGTIKKWDAGTGAELATFKGHGPAIWALASSADGSRAVAGFSDGYWTAWDAVQARMVGSIKAHSNTISTLAMTPDGRIMLAGSYDATISVWNLDSGARVHTLIGHYGKVMATAITPDGKFALSGSDDRGILLWDVASGENLRALGGHSDWVMAVAISADGKTGISASFDCTIRLWNLETGAVRHVFQTRGGAVTALAVTPDFSRAVSGSEGPWLEVWDLKNCTSIAAFRGDGEFRGTAISVDGSRIFATDQLGRIHIFELES